MIWTLYTLYMCQVISYKEHFVHKRPFCVKCVKCVKKTGVISYKDFVYEMVPEFLHKQTEELHRWYKTSIMETFHILNKKYYCMYTYTRFTQYTSYLQLQMRNKCSGSTPKLLIIVWNIIGTCIHLLKLYHFLTKCYVTSLVHVCIQFFHFSALKLRIKSFKMGYYCDGKSNM